MDSNGGKVTGGTLSVAGASLTCGSTITESVTTTEGNFNLKSIFRNVKEKWNAFWNNVVD